MATISSPGLGSGLDIAGLVSKLVAAEGQPTSLRLDRKEASLQADLSAYGSLRGSLSAFSSTLATLSALSNFQAKSATSTDDTVAKGTASNTAAAGTYDITVSALAKAHTLATPSGSFTNVTDAVGTGTLTFKFGTTDHTEPDTYTSFTQNPSRAVETVTIDSSNNSLQGIRDAINAADIGVNATIINDGSGYRLVLKSNDTGAANSIQITVDDDDLTDTNTSGLSILAFNASATNLEQTVAAQDASLSINNIAVTSETNTLTDAIEGVTLSLLKESSATLTVTTDVSTVTANINSFVSSYNSLIGSINNLTKFDANDSSKSGVLLGDGTTRTILTEINGILTGTVAQLGGPYSILADIGITRNLDGTLAIDNSKLQDALDTNFDAVAGLFVAKGDPTDSLINYTTSTSDTQIGTYAVGITQLATQGSINGNTTASLADDGGGNFTVPFNIDTDNDTFKVTVDGIESDTITLSTGDYTTTASLVTEIQTRINGDTNLKNNGITVSVSFDATNDRLVITSDRYGSASNVSFTGVDTNTAAELGFDTALTGTDGVDLAGTINGVTGAGSGRFLTGATGDDASGLKLEILGGSTGSRGTVAFSRGYADQLKTLIDGLLDTDGVLQARTDGIQGSIDDIGGEREALSLRLDSLQARLLKQFNAMDALVAQLNSTSNFLTQQLANLPGVYTRNTSNNG